MELGGYGFEKSELLKLAEQIYDCKGKKQQLELELASEEFHQRYIPKRKEMLERRVTTNFPVLAGLFFVLLLSVLLVVYYIVNYDEVRDDGIIGVFLLAAGMLIIFGGYAFVRLMRSELKMAVRFTYSKKPERAMRFAGKYDINTFQDDEIRTEQRVSNLKAQIEAIDEKLSKLNEREREIIEEAKKRENVLKKYDIIKEISQKETDSSKGSFSLKEDYGMDITELNEYYTKEESYLRYVINDLEIKKKQADKEIIEIDDEFELVKKRAAIFLTVYIIAIIVQSIIPGFIGGMVGGFCFFAGLYAVFALERTCEGPVIRYLVEHENPWIAEYAFHNDIVPVSRRRNEITMLIKQNEDAVNEIKRKKQELDI